MKQARDAAIVYINGDRHEVRGDAAFLMLADFLRYERGLTGTKIVCAEGDCGACTVLRARYSQGKIGRFSSINSCIVTMAQLDGTHLVTIEGLQDKGELSPVQKAVMNCHGSQCGYCTPGFVVAMTGALQGATERMSEQSAKNALTGNLCRCTGYTPLIQACASVDPKSLPSLEARFVSPGSVKDLKAASALPLHIVAGELEFFAPTVIEDAGKLLKKFPAMRVLASATDLGVQMNKRGMPASKFLSLHLVPKLDRISSTKTRMTFGARVSLTEVRDACLEKLPEFARFLNIFASPQIKNIGTLVGNVANASPIGDTQPFLLVCDAEVQVVGGRSPRKIPMTELYAGYRKLNLKPGEVIEAISVRIPSPAERLRVYKVSQRKDLDISAVNAAFLTTIKEGAIADAKIAYGGVGPTVLRFPKVEGFLHGKAPTQAVIDEALGMIQAQINPLSDVRGTSAYRRALVEGLFRRYWEDISSGGARMNPDMLILKDKGSAVHDSAATHVSGASEFVDDRPAVRGELQVGLVWSPHAKARILDIRFDAALKIPGVVCVLTHKDVHHQNWGTIFEEQPFLASDQVNYVGEVVAVVGATTKAALAAAIRTVQVDYEVLEPILSIDAAIAKESFIGSCRSISRGDAVDAIKRAPKRLSGRVVIRGAEHFYLENQAALVYPKEGGLMEVHSSTQHPTETQHLVADALGIPQNQVICITKRLGGGFGGKETQAAPFAVYAALVAKASGKSARIVLTKDDDMIITGKRNPFQCDYEVGFDFQGNILGLKAKHWSDGGAYADLSTAIMERALLHSDNAYFIPNMFVEGQVCRTNFHSHTAFRGFGGPKGVGMIESVIEDIALTLGIDALDVRQRNVYAPGRDVTHYGQTVENNMLPRLFTQLEASCRYRERRIELDEHNRDLTKNPRGMAMTAVKFGISFTTRFLNQGNAMVNIHRDGSIQVSTGAVEMGQGVNARIAKLVADEFGLDQNRVRVMVTSTEKNANTSPTAASSGTDINGAAAVVACQKVKNRLSELILKLMEIPRENWAGKTAGLGTMPEVSVSDSGQASEQVVFEKGMVYPKGQPDRALPFASLIAEAYFNRISVSEYGYYKIPDLGFNKLSGQGRAFLYFTQGVACSEVEVDRWTGEVKVLATDILMDLGRPVNHALDIGQISGAFIQGMGWVTTEALYYNTQGKLLSHSPSTYKIPSIQDTPRHFQIDLIPNETNYANVKGTKAAGEPPLMLCFSVWNAIANAIRNRRLAEGLEAKPVHLPVPATAEITLRAMKPELFAKFEGANGGGRV